ncbi:MAG: MarR family transcriptional regulator [Lactimicrobium sp.]|jgi:DNA-binding MarR family transcriptional regulator|uniref:MarR family winged helix-turn-helix transcriptional regulator n=1 Tax=Lactimicrobium sp. TaxID=2563780 RepID=UPI002F35BAB8
MQKEDCGMLIKQINDQLEKDANNDMRAQDLTLIQASILLQLENCEQETASMKEIEKFLGVAQPTAVGIVQRMELKKLVTSFTSSEDKRIKLVHLSTEGKQKAGFARKQMAMTEARITSSLNEEEQAQFAQYLHRVRDSLKTR